MSWKHVITSCPSCGLPMPSGAIPRHLPACLGSDPITLDSLIKASRRTITEDGCWEWGGYRSMPTGRNKKGYGRLSTIARRRLGAYQAHIAAYTLVNGLVPNGLRVLHHCDNPPCFNPEHLYAGTPKENTRDALERGRFILPPKATGRPGPGKLPRETSTCPICGNQYNNIIGGTKERKTCSSQKCMYQMVSITRKGEQKTWTCPRCQKPFTTTPSKKRKYCSKKCQFPNPRTECPRCGGKKHTSTKQCSSCVAQFGIWQK
jgi:HNH endonuclease